MVKGFNALFGDNKKLGSWESYLEMRAVILHANAEVRDQLSKGLGAFAGLLFEIGTGGWKCRNHSSIGKGKNRIGGQSPPH
jgi:type II restriction enzyme